MPIPTPHADEDEQKFVSRCMGDAVMRADYTDQKQRSAVCYSQWRRAKKGVAKTLLVKRPLTNADEFIAWAKSQGFKTTLPAADIHVTVAFSRTPIDWDKVGDHFDVVRVEDGERSVEPLGDEGAVVLRFECPELTQRWQQIIDAGASWDYSSYKPHVSITYDGVGVDLDDVAPYDGELIFGPERFAEVKEDWKDDVKESSVSIADGLVAYDLQGSKERITKEEADYVNHPVAGNRCGKCTMFEAPDGCTLVRGSISMDGWCRFFESVMSKAPPPSWRLIDRIVVQKYSEDQPRDERGRFGEGGGGGSSIYNSAEHQEFQQAAYFDKETRHEDLPIKDGIKSNPKQCTQEALKGFQENGEELHLGQAYDRASYEKTFEWWQKTGVAGSPGSFAHAWNVKDGKIIDRALGSREGKDYLYFGIRIPSEFLGSVKSGDELASKHFELIRAAYAKQTKTSWLDWRKYSEDQPRDERGRFGEGGSSTPSATSNDGKPTSKLDTKESKAVEMYASADGSELNGTLRDVNGRLGYINSKVDRENIRQLDKAIAKGQLDREVTLYRGISDESAIGHMEASVGKQVEFPAYSSTTHDVGVARGYAAEEGGKGLTMEIRVPSGFPALNVGQAIPSKRPGSDEFVLPRGTVMEIHSVSAGVVRATVLHSPHQWGT